MSNIPEEEKEEQTDLLAQNLTVFAPRDQGQHQGVCVGQPARAGKSNQ